MPMRLSGMYSGLDTESIISELVKAKSTKVDSLKKDKTSLEWKQSAWKDLNTKIKNFQTSISTFRFTTSYAKKTTKVSNSSAVSVITGEAAMNGVQSLSVNQLAKSGYMTGAKLRSSNDEAITSDTTLGDLRFKTDSEGNETSGIATLTETGGSFTVTVGDKASTINVNKNTKISELVTSLKNAGVDANFDEKNGRIFIASTASGYDKDFSITANNAEGFSALTSLGINEELGSSTDTSENANAKTLATYQKYASFNSALSSIPADKAVTVTKTREVTKEVTDEEGNTVYEEDGVTPKTETVTEEYEDTEYVLNTEDFWANIDTKSDLYKAIKAEMTSDADYEAAISKLKDKAAFATEITSGTSYTSDMYSSDAVRIAGQDATITLNGVEYTSSSNNVEVNGLTFSCLAVADDITVTTEEDTDGIYDMIKGLIKQYNELIKEMDTLYNAESASKYEPLTDDEKEAMSDKEVEEWEKKIKDSILRRDSSLSTVLSTLKTGMQAGYEINGKKTYLSDFGIETLSYFTAAENEKSLLHIAGNPDDSETSGNADKLKSMIANDPETVISYFTQMARDLYKGLSDISSATDYQSYGSFYEDKKYKTDVSSYETKVSEAEDRLNDYEDKYYKKFSNMEVALSKLESSTSSITSLLGN